MNILYPPRPFGKMSPGELPKYEATGQWVAQRKYNGQRNPIHISETGKVSFFGYGKKHDNFVTPKWLLDEFKELKLQKGQQYWLDSELLDNKTKDDYYKNRVILFDVLWAGKYLFYGPTLTERLEMLAGLCGNPSVSEPKHQIAVQVTEHVWMAETFVNGFAEEFYRLLDFDEIEGLVLKLKNSKIDNIGNKKYEVTWQLRCRKPHAGGNYSH